jgi:hypothetical protein
MKAVIKTFKGAKIIRSLKGVQKKPKFHRILFSDIETTVKSGTHEVLCISITFGNSIKTFPGIIQFMNFIYKECQDSAIYFHNFGRFDSFFILKHLIIESEMEPDDFKILERNNIIYEINIKNYGIYIRDSYLLIPMSLDNLGHSFCDNYKKKDFDYSRMDEIWEKDKTSVIEQCQNDCLTLKEGFTNFGRLVYDKFDIKIEEQLTLPSLALSIFKQNFYDHKKDPIYKNPYAEDQFIRRSYKGGISEVFKPYLENGFLYDVNSLYPFCMMKYCYPVGPGKFINGSDIDLKDFIGFIECNVSTNKELNFLTYRHKTKGLISPVGYWKDVYTHFEIKKAIELGYNIEILRGFKYERTSPIFKGFVNEIYKMRIESKTPALNQLTKLILNSLYGRFGMKTFVVSTKFVKKDQINEIKEVYQIRNIEEIAKGYHILSVFRRANTDSEIYSISADTETAVQLASFITAYARLYMYDFKNIIGNPCYYTDTDSVFLKKELDSKYVSNKELGLFKLECKIKEAYFIAPKVYSLDFVKTNGEREIKIVAKGLKAIEYTKNKMIQVFKKIVNNEKDDKGDFSHIKISRTNFFRRKFNDLTINKEISEMKTYFPFNKREKILKDNIWVDTKAPYIKEIGPIEKKPKYKKD